jgi:hypothetical protein
MKKPVFSEHEDAKGSQSGQAIDAFNLVVIKVEKDKSSKRVQILNPSDGVVLIVEQPKLVFTIEDWADDKSTTEKSKT